MSTTVAKPEFDAYAGSYDQALNQGLSLTGEGKDYFAAGRVRWLARRLKQRRFQPKRVLDFGCGTGTATPHFLEQLGAQAVLGLDVSAASIEVATKTFGQEHVRFRCCADHRGSGEYDLAFSNGVFHHIPPVDRPGALRQVFASLRPSGLFAFWENNPWNPGTRFIMSRIPFDRDAIMVWPRGAHRLLGDAGFEILLTDFAFVFPASLFFLRGLEPWLCKAALGGQYLVLARRPV